MIPGQVPTLRFAIRMGSVYRFLSYYLILFLLFVTSSKAIANRDSVPTIEDLKNLEALAVKTVAKAWDLTGLVKDTDATISISDFWKKLKTILNEVHQDIKGLDQKIHAKRPAAAMNKIVDLQDLTALKVLSDTTSQNPFIHWRVKWVEINSMATHIHTLYNKRIKDIMNDEPYVKTVAMAIQKYMSYPWYSRVSGNLDDRYRFHMRTYPELIEDRLISVEDGDLFVGLRRLIEDNPTAAVSSAMEYGFCTGNQTIGKIVPAGIENPIYVLVYIGLVDIKYFILQNFYFLYYQVYETIEYGRQSELVKELNARLEKKIKLYQDAFKNLDVLMKQLPATTNPGYFRCDPPQKSPKNPVRNHILQSTYIKLTNFLQVFVAPEKQLSDSKGCKGDCGLLDGVRNSCNATTSPCSSKYDPGCAIDAKKCTGSNLPCPLHDIVCVDSSPEISYCPSKRSDRLMEWAKVNNLNYGEDAEQCDNIVLTASGSARRTPADQPCNVCLCHCYSAVGDEKTSIRTFSLKPALSDVTNNKIVVGIKFHLESNQIHLMIAEASARSNSAVDMSTLTWRKPKAADESAIPPQSISFSRDLRAIHLGDAVAPPKHVVTGVRFYTGTYTGLYSHQYIGLQVQITEIDTSGKLVQKTSKWIQNSDNVNEKQPYNYIDPDDPEKADGPALPDSSNNHFITFRTTSISKDLGQNTIPFFDAQQVILADKSGWLKGIGIYHKVRPRFGGFLGLKILKYGDDK